MALIKLDVLQRSTKGKNENRRTRDAGYIPAVIYGKDRRATAVQLDSARFTQIQDKSGGRSVIFDLQLEGEAERPLALMREIQRHPVSDKILHVDLFEIPRGVPVTIDVSLVLEGQPTCVKYNEGELLQLIDSVELSCLPRELPECIKVDVADLALNDKLYVKDLTIPVGTVMSDPETQVLVVKPVSIFAEEEETAAEAAGDEPDAAAQDTSPGDKTAD